MLSWFSSYKHVEASLPEPVTTVAVPVVVVPVKIVPSQDDYTRIYGKDGIDGLWEYIRDNQLWCEASWVIIKKMCNASDIIRLLKIVIVQPREVIGEMVFTPFLSLVLDLVRSDEHDQLQFYFDYNLAWNRIRQQDLTAIFRGNAKLVWLRQLKASKLWEELVVELGEIHAYSGDEQVLYTIIEEGLYNRVSDNLLLADFQKPLLLAPLLFRKGMIPPTKFKDFFQKLVREELARVFLMISSLSDEYLASLPLLIKMYLLEFFTTTHYYSLMNKRLRKADGQENSSPGEYLEFLLASILEEEPQLEVRSSITPKILASKDGNCVVCCEENYKVLFSCGHLATCLDCSKKVNQCPVCREPLLPGDKREIFPA